MRCLYKATVCESMELIAALGSAFLRKRGGDVAYSVSAVGSSFFYATHRHGSCSALVWRGEMVSPDFAFVTGAFPCGRPSRRDNG